MGFKNLVLMFGGSLCAWMCGCGEDDDYVPSEPENMVSVLIVDDLTNNFEGGEVYHYNEHYPTYNLTVENVPPADVGYIKVHYTEGNQLIYHATQVFMGSGEIIVPNPIMPPQDFGRVLTEDFMALPNDAVELTNAPSPTGKAQEKWAQIQNLEVVRYALQNNTGKVHYFKQVFDSGLVENAKWIFIVKN